VVNTKENRPNIWQNMKSLAREVFTEENLLQFGLKALEIIDLNSVSEELKAWLNEYTRASARLRKLTVALQKGWSSRSGVGAVTYHAGR